MKHFANFIRLSDKNINSARTMIDSGSYRNNYVKNSFPRLSGFDPNKTKSIQLDYHDDMQHGMVTKDLYRAATGQNPNQYFRKGSLQEQAKVMPLVQNRQLSAQERGTANNTIESVVRAVANPTNISEKYGQGLNTTAINAYTRKKFGGDRRLAASTSGKTLVHLNDFDHSKYYPKEKDNQAFRNNYIKEAKDNDKLKSSLEKQLSSKLKLDQPPKISIKDKMSSMLGFSTDAGNKLRNKLKTREAYSKQFDNTNSLEREVALKLYGQTGLMPR